MTTFIDRFSDSIHGVLSGFDRIRFRGTQRLLASVRGLTAFLAFILKQSSRSFKIITPSVSTERGTQLSILTDENGKKLFDFLSENGVICDWREPNVIRLAPVALYCSYEDVWRVGQLMQ